MKIFVKSGSAENRGRCLQIWLKGRIEYGIIGLKWLEHVTKITLQTCMLYDTD